MFYVSDMHSIQEVLNLAEHVLTKANVKFDQFKEHLIRSSYNDGRIFCYEKDGVLLGFAIGVSGKIDRRIIGTNIKIFPHNPRSEEVLITDIYLKDSIPFSTLFLNFKERFKKGYLAFFEQGKICRVKQIWSVMPACDHEELCSLLRESFNDINTQVGLVEFRFADAPEYNFSLRINKTGSDFLHEAAREDEVNTSIYSNLEDISALLFEKEILDIRTTEHLNTISFDGDIKFGFYILNSLLRPRPETIERFQVAKQLKVSNDYIPRISLDRSEEIQQAITQEKIPIIITGIREKWPTIEFGIDGFLHKHGSENFFPHLDFTIHDIVKKICDPEDKYNYTGGVRLPPSLDNIFKPVVEIQSELIAPQIWMGIASNPNVPLTGLHRDCTDGFLGQVFGDKIVYLYPPNEEDNLYLSRGYNNYQMSKVLHHAPDYELFPKFKNAQCIKIELKQGELLYQPAGWFHCVYTPSEFTMSVSYFEKSF